MKKILLALGVFLFVYFVYIGVQVAIFLFTEQTNEVVVQEVVVPEMTAQEIAEREKLREQDLAKWEKVQEQRRAERLAEEKVINLSIFKASDKVLNNILSDCRRLVKKYADSGSYSSYMIDEWSADAYKYLASNNATMTDKERIKNLRNSQGDTSLNTDYAILSTTDSFSGLKKSVNEYQCVIKKGPRAAFAKRK